ncbi:hypothetical protein F1C10_04145 [Sphingomonas sp. NBWT7]|uniref:hypothetical protein n=1 Tax=Sphingomonas sp. NBWT7 TaxID=2596913 RepID=UPI00162A6C85|nr:hypothetical protein [Sphingomonas sp. NBWT7]QNE31209.1 hypothetical protein F1C10_04145 [Sphingomonas sp. NBWT7]
MMSLVSFGVFAGTFGISAYAIAATVVPRVDRIVAALRGQSQTQFHPLATLVQAERRIAVRRWAAQPRPVPSQRLRAAA